MKIKKGDIVKVITGKFRGKEGKIISVLPRRNMVIVEGINKVKKHEKQSTNQDRTKTGGIIEVEAPIHASNVMMIDAKTGKSTRVGYKIDKAGKKKRVSKKSNNLID